MRALTYVGALSALLHSNLAAAEGAPPKIATEGFTKRCAAAAPAGAMQKLFDRLKAAEKDPGCKFEGLATDKFRSEIRFSKGAKPLPPTKLAPNECLESPSFVGQDFSLAEDEALAKACPRIHGVLKETLKAAPMGAKLEGPPPRPKEQSWTDPPNALGAAAQHLVALLMLASLGLGAYLGVKRARTGTIERPTLALLIGGFLFALFVRLGLVEPALTNWYTEVLPREGDYYGRFGPGAYTYQKVLRALGWSDGTLFTANAVMGSLAVPLTVAIVRARQGHWLVAVTAAVAIALSPLHARISASASAHVLASTCVLASLLAWTVAVRSERWSLAALSMMLASAAALTRVGPGPALLAIPVWGWLLDRGERTSSRRARLTMPVAFVVAWAHIGALSYFAIVQPSNHPGPETASYLQVARQLLSQYAIVGFAPPHWISPVEVVLAGTGVVAFARRRPLWLIAIGAALALSFVPLGRNLVHDQLVGGRYFLTAIALFGILAGLGLQGIADATAWALRRVGRELPIVPALLVVTFAVSTLLVSRPAYAARFTFQDEYDFLDASLSQLPPGCIVYQLPLRQSRLNRDLDCCLDAARSPLILHPSKTRLRHLYDTAPHFPEKAFDGQACVAYFEAASCGLRETADVLDREPAALPTFRGQCAAVRQEVRLESVAEAEVSGRAINNQFGGQPVRVRLLRAHPRR